MAKVIFCLILLKLAASQDCGYCTSCMKRDSRQILITVELIGSESILAKVGNKIIQGLISNFKFGFFHQYLSYFNCHVWKHYLTGSFRFAKTRQNGPFSAFLINVCPLKM